MLRSARPALAALAAVISLLLPTEASAQTATPAVGGLGPWGYLGLAFNLGLVLLAIWAAVMAMRWYVRRMNGEVGGARQLQVLESRALGPNRSLHLVRLADRAVLLGVTSDRINALMTVDDPEEVQRMVASAAAGSENSLRRVAGDISGLAGISLRGASTLPNALPSWLNRATWDAFVRRVWTGPARRPRRPRPQAMRPMMATAAPVRVAVSNTPLEASTDALGTAMQRAAAAAYSRESSISAAQRAIAAAQAVDPR